MVRSVVLLPYCPLPIDTGAKSEMWKYLQVLRELGPCRIASASKRPVGAGWNKKRRKSLEELGFEICLREETVSSHRTFGQSMGILYGALCKGLHLERAFLHANPYHRYAFPPEWWRAVSKGADLAVINYSYWAQLPCDCPKVLVLHDLLSSYMWWGTRIETRDIKSCSHVFAISLNEVDELKKRGVSSVSWSPPAVQRSDIPLIPSCAVLGSANRFNIEGLRWLESGGDILNGEEIRIYGALSNSVSHKGLVRVGSYEDSKQPFRENGIILLTTIQGMGVQIKIIEALAAGRAIIVRRGAMRGLPLNEQSWIEVNSPKEAVECVHRLRTDPKELQRWANRAHAYYLRYLDADRIKEDIRNIYLRLIQP